MRRRGRPRGERLDAAQADRVHDQLQPAQERVGLGRVGLELEARHAAEAREETTGALVLRVAGQAGIVDLRHLRVALQPRRHLERALVLRRHPQRERLDATLEQEAGVGVGAAAQVDELVPDLLHERRAAGHAARDQVRVAVQVLGRAVDHEVEAHLDGPQVDRRREGAVDEGGEAVRARETHDALQVGHLQPRVGERLHVDGFGLGTERRLPAGRARRVDEGVREAEVLQVVRHEGVRAAVQRVLGDEVAAAAQRDEQRGRDGRHPARRHEAGFRAFEVGQLPAERLVVRHVARADVADVVVAARLPRQEHARVVDRRGDGSARTTLRLTGVDGARVASERTCLAAFKFVLLSHEGPNRPIGAWRRP